MAATNGTQPRHANLGTGGNRIRGGSSFRNKLPPGNRESPAPVDKDRQDEASYRARIGQSTWRWPLRWLACLAFLELPLVFTSSLSRHQQTSTAITSPPLPPLLAPILNTSFLASIASTAMFNLPTIRLRFSLSLPKLNLGRRLQRALIRVILAALFIARAEIRAVNVQGMLVSWFRFCPEFREGAKQPPDEWASHRSY